MSVAPMVRPAAAPGRRSVMLLPADRAGCGLYRMILPARGAMHSDRGFDIEVGTGIMGEVRRDNDTGRLFVNSLPQIDHDLIVFQRPFDAIVAECIPIAQRQGVACVVELDDDVRQIDPRNAAWPLVQPKLNPASNWQNIVDACRAADWVTVSTPELRWYAPHGRVSVIPNAVPRSMTQHVTPPREPGAPVVVGWAGAIATHPGDLEETLGGVANAVESTGAVFHVVGSPDGVRQSLRLATEPTSSGWVALNAYPEALTALDVGIVPLTPAPFNRSKSWLKGLEMAALGIPFVASPLPEYVRLRDEYGVGIIAKRPAEWARELRKLILDADYRAETGATWRARIADALTMDHTHDAWMDAWDSALAHRHGTRPARRAAHA